MMKCKTCGADHRGVEKHGGYCLDHQERRAEAAESALKAVMARAAQAEAERDEARRQLEQAQATFGRMNEIIKKIAKEREDIREERDNLRMSIVNNVSA